MTGAAERPMEPDQHSRDHAARMLADPNYPSEFERGALLYRQVERYEWKQASNLLAMVDEARAQIARLSTALRPFAAAADIADDYGRSDEYDTEGLLAFDCGDLRAARAAVRGSM